MAAVRILVVDAHDDERRRCADLLRREGFDVVAVERPELADGPLSGRTPVAALIEDADAKLTGRLVDMGVPVFGVSDVFTGATNRALAMLRDGVAEYWSRPVPADELFGWLRRIVGDDWPEPVSERATSAPPAVAVPEPAAPAADPDATPPPIANDEPPLISRVDADGTPIGGVEAADAETFATANRPAVGDSPAQRASTRPPWKEPPTQAETTRVADTRSLARDAEPTPAAPPELRPVTPTPAPARAVASITSAAEPWVPSELDVRLVGEAGEIGDTAFATLLAHLAYGRVTGALRLQQGEDKRLVYIEDGFPVSARTNRADITVSDMIHDSGLLPDEAMQRVKRHARQHRVSTSQALLELDLFDRDELDLLASASLRNKLLDLFAWDEGVYSFKSGTVPRNYRHDPVISPMDLIWEGVLHGVPVSLLRRTLDPVLERPVVLLTDPPSAEEMRLTRSQERFLARIDGRTTWFAMTREGLVNEDVQRLLYVLVATGIVAFGEPSNVDAVSA